MGLVLGNQHEALAAEDNVFDELKTTRSTSWQFELRQMEKRNRLLAEELQSLLSSKKKRKRRNGAGNLQKDCANCHTRVTPEWRRGPSGNRDLCNGCGLRWAKEVGSCCPIHSDAFTKSTRMGESHHEHRRRRATRIRCHLQGPIVSILSARSTRRQETSQYLCPIRGRPKPSTLTGTMQSWREWKRLHLKDSAEVSQPRLRKM